MRRFGGLSAVMKITWVTFGLGWLAIIGFPLLSGFWSKDKIIEAAFVGDGWRPWVFGGAALVGAGITAFYMSRLFFMTFHGKRRWRSDGENAVHPHESPLVMTVPMMVLAVGSAVLGVILGPTGIITSWLGPVVGEHGEEHPVLSVPVITGLTLLFVAVGLALAWLRYLRDDVPETAPTGSLLTRAARRDLYQDEVNEGLFMRPGIHLTRSLVFADNRGVDGAVGGLAALVGGTSSRVRRLQNGFARSYALTMLAGVVVILGALWVIQ
jgi:NADH-quinone oxidoreductase subunit L